MPYTSTPMPTQLRGEYTTRAATYGAWLIFAPIIRPVPILRLGEPRQLRVNFLPKEITLWYQRRRWASNQQPADCETNALVRCTTTYRFCPWLWFPANQDDVVTLLYWCINIFINRSDSSTKLMSFWKLNVHKQPLLGHQNVYRFGR